MAFADPVRSNLTSSAGRPSASPPTDADCGEKYLLIFATRGKHDAISSDIGDFNTFVAGPVEARQAHDNTLGCRPLQS